MARTVSTVGKGRTMTPSARILRNPLHAQVADVLRDQIVRGTLLPGAKLNEVELCEALSISRTPLREALKILEAESLIEIRPHRGATVAAISRRSVEEIFQLLAPLESLAAKLAVQRMSREDLCILHETHDLMIACYAAGDREGCFLHDVDFHDQLVAFSGNEVLQTVHTSLANRSRRGRFLAPRFSQQKLDIAMAAHKELILAISGRDAARAADLMEVHVRKTGEFVIDSVDQAQSSAEKSMQPAVSFDR